MNDYQRRKELLAEYSGTHCYRNHHEDITDRLGERQPQKSTVGIRITLCIVLFVCYVLLDYENLTILNVNSKAVKNEIRKEVDLGELLHITTEW
ncbi:hypothetical protein [Hespellia stercorisuis]|uniref:Uncharacterized protein n=1 Tax=Hespellia stercorisuis DSM 15480 TaxID=1121950 RepID=A0A1M6S3R9_9FIRM|nr:hypothetical protein [Hespellia stercorisuis]SHK39393.1 hypothetical protein SAMN02745243_02843 [Hespellia stercorisuis DSM 15480]